MELLRRESARESEARGREKALQQEELERQLAEKRKLASRGMEMEAAEERRHR